MGSYGVIWGHMGSHGKRQGRLRVRLGVVVPPAALRRGCACCGLLRAYVSTSIQHHVHHHLLAETLGPDSSAHTSAIDLSDLDSHVFVMITAGDIGVSG